MADGNVTISTEIDNSGIEQGLREMQTETRRAARSADDISEGFDDASNRASRSLDEIEGGLNDLRGTVTNIAGAIGVAFGIGAIADFATGIVAETDELRGDLAMLEQNAIRAGASLDVTSEAFQRLNTLSGEADSSVEAVSNLLAAGIPENKLQGAVEGLSNAVVMFPDTLKIESLADSLQETLATGQATGQFGELLDRLGIGAENFSAKLAMATTEAQKQDLILNVLNSGSLKGLYDGWAQANPELVEGRDSSMRLQMAMAGLAEQIQPILADITDLAAGVAEWVGANIDVEKFFQLVVSGVAALGSVKAIEMIKLLYAALDNFVTTAGLAQAKTALLAISIGALVYVGMQLAEAWDSMSDGQKVVAMLGLVTAAALAAAVAVGAFQSALTLGVAAVGIAAGIAAVLVAIKGAQSQVDAYNANMQTPNLQSGGQTFSSIPQLATGAVIPPNRRFTAVLGDQTNGRNLEAPESLIRQIVREESGGGSGGVDVTVNFSGSLSGLARYLAPKIEVAQKQRGSNLIKRGGST